MSTPLCYCPDHKSVGESAGPGLRENVIRSKLERDHKEPLKGFNRRAMRSALKFRKNSTQSKEEGPEGGKTQEGNVLESLLVKMISR